MTDRSDLIATAHHEAGHWVASEDLSPSRLRLSLDVSAKGGRLGALSEEEVSIVGDRQDYENEVVGLYAGHEAEVRLDPKIADETRSGSWDDEEQAKEILESLEPDEGQRIELERRLRKRATEIIERRWGAVQLLAQGLAEWERLDPDICSLLIALAEDDPDQTPELVLVSLHVHDHVTTGEDGRYRSLPEWLWHRLSRRWPEILNS